MMIRSLMWSLSNLKDPGGNILTMLVIIVQNTWILNTVVFQYKWWLFLFMSLFWFCSCNTATRFCEGGNNTWFLYQKKKKNYVPWKTLPVQLTINSTSAFSWDNHHHLDPWQKCLKCTSHLMIKNVKEMCIHSSMQLIIALL